MPVFIQFLADNPPLWLLGWCPVALWAVGPGQRAKALMFIGFCVFSLALQIELMESLSITSGLTGWIDLPGALRGVFFYMAAIVLYLFLVILSPGARGVILLAASLTIYIFSFVGSTILMVI